MAGLRLRCHDPEWIDSVEVRGPDLRRMLRELEVINRLLGGTAASVGEVLLRTGSAPTVSLLDVGAGGGDFLRALGAALDRRRVRGRLVGIDASPESCSEAARGGQERRPPDAASGARPIPAFSAGRPARSSAARRSARYAAADAFRLPFPAASFDLVHCALFLHHFRSEQIAPLLAEMLRVARAGVIVNDLERHPIAYHGIRLLTGLFSRSPYIRNDAPLSVRRGFRAEDLDEAWRGAGLPPPRIRRRWAFRFLVWVPASGAGAPFASGHDPRGRDRRGVSGRPFRTGLLRDGRP